jgi:hypothetical protein
MLRYGGFSDEDVKAIGKSDWECNSCSPRITRSSTIDSIFNWNRTEHRTGIHDIQTRLADAHRKLDFEGKTLADFYPRTQEDLP